MSGTAVSPVQSRVWPLILCLAAWSLTEPIPMTTAAQAAPRVSLTITEAGATVEGYTETVGPLNPMSGATGEKWVESGTVSDPVQGGIPSAAQPSPAPRPRGLDHLSTVPSGLLPDATQATMDEILNQQQVSTRPVIISLNKGNPGTRGHTFSVPGKVSVKAYLMTRGQASLRVVLKKASGSVIEWMTWSRSGGGDPSPLYVDGRKYPSSMYEQNPGDFSPKPTTVSRSVEAGDRVELTLGGNFGTATPLLEMKGRDK